MRGKLAWEKRDCYRGRQTHRGTRGEVVRCGIPQCRGSDPLVGKGKGAKDGAPRERWRMRLRCGQRGAQTRVSVLLNYNDVAMRGITARRRAMKSFLMRAPVAKTSSAVSGAPVMPAAMLVTQEMPRTRMLLWRAARTSGTVDMPTRSAPSERKAWISAGVS